ncbi:MAG: hypothetical protein JNN01_09540 [Opitutaceae bacterium]|nr:hypothetical protein [Opitutaceae bacterium]
MASRRLVFPVLGLVLGALALHGAEPRIEVFRFAADGAVTFRLDTFQGEIKVETDSQPEIRLRVISHSRVPAYKSATTEVGRLNCRADQAPGAVTVIVSFEGKSPLFSREEWPPVEVSFELTVPRTCVMDLATGEGAIRLGELSAPTRVKTGSGLVFCRQAGQRLEAVSGGGDLVVSRSTGDLKLQTAGGAIRVGSVEGSADLDNRSGDVEILVARKGLVARAEAGDIEAGLPRRLLGAYHLETKGGSILLGLDPQSSVRLEATSVWGKVSSKLPLQPILGKLESRQFQGKLNAGEVTVVAKASGGHVRIESRPDNLPRVTGE